MKVPVPEVAGLKILDETLVPLNVPPEGVPYETNPSVSSSSHKSGKVDIDEVTAGSTVMVEVSDAEQPLDVAV